MDVKICIRCQLQKQLNEYGLSSSFSDGRNSTCKDCSNKSAKLWRQSKEKKNFIYTISCAITKCVVYVGKTTCYNIDIRKSIHFGNTKGVKTPISFWIKNQSTTPLFDIIDIVDDDVYYWEKYYIEQLRHWGFNLLNVNHNKYDKKRNTTKW